MEEPTPDGLRREARRCHALAAGLSKVADKSALQEYAAMLDQQAADLEGAEQAQIFDEKEH